MAPAEGRSTSTVRTRILSGYIGCLELNQAQPPRVSVQHVLKHFVVQLAALHALHIASDRDQRFHHDANGSWGASCAPAESRGGITVWCP